MKLGNISQSILPVPNFFLDRSLRQIETFNLYNKTHTNFYNKYNKKNPISLKKNIQTEINLDDSSSINSKKIPKSAFKRKDSYFRDKDVLTTFYNLNINNNPRCYDRQFFLMNKQKYIPSYYLKQSFSLNQNKKTYFPNIIDLNKTNYVRRKNIKSKLVQKCLENYNNFKKYKNIINLEEFFSPNLREDIQNNTKNLIDKINMNYDIKSWTEFDSRVTFNRFFQTAYSPINDVNKNQKSLKDKFSETLKQKALSLKNINNQTKNVIKNNFLKSEEENMKNQNNEEIIDEKYYDIILDNCRSNLLRLKYNNIIDKKYNKKDKLFIDENEYITKRLNKTKLYKEFPSKTREEFNEKTFVKFKELNKYNKIKKKIIKKNKYGNVDKDNKKNGEKNYLKNMWERPLHKDAYILHK